MAELVYAHDLKSCLVRDVGSIPTPGTEIKRLIWAFLFCILILRPGAELNRRIKILQIFALPLGYQAEPIS